MRFGHADDGEIGGDVRGVGEMETAAHVAVVFTCHWCGQRIELRSSEAGPELLDAQQFLAAHAGCLHRVKQRRSH